MSYDKETNFSVSFLANFDNFISQCEDVMSRYYFF